MFCNRDQEKVTQGLSHKIKKNLQTAAILFDFGAQVEYFVAIKLIVKIF